MHVNAFLLKNIYIYFRDFFFSTEIAFSRTPLTGIVWRVLRVTAQLKFVFTPLHCCIQRLSSSARFTLEFAFRIAYIRKKCIDGKWAYIFRLNRSLFSETSTRLFRSNSVRGLSEYRPDRHIFLDASSAS